MSVESAEYLEAATHLPAGGRLILYGVEWEDYERILAGIGDASSLRMSYDHGRLDIMSPSAKHEKYKSLLHDLVVVIGDELSKDVASFGSVTLRQHSGNRGVEADDCFYITNAAVAIRLGALDLENDPPPDLVIEVDLTHESSNKFAIYAGFGVPEIWRYDGSSLAIFQLVGPHYRQVEHSLAFPFLSSDQIEASIEDTEADGPFQARQQLRAWIRANKP